MRPPSLSQLTYERRKQVYRTYNRMTYRSGRTWLGLGIGAGIGVILLMIVSAFRPHFGSPIVAGAFAGVLIALPLVAINMPTMRQLYRRALEESGVCVQCGYDRVGHPDGPCPKCGFSSSNV